MTRPLPVTAYAAVSPDGYKYITGIGEHSVQFAPDVSGVIPVTIIPTEQYEAMVEALEKIAKQMKTDEIETEYDEAVADFEQGYDDCIDTARAALAALKEQTNA